MKTDIYDLLPQAGFQQRASQDCSPIQSLHHRKFLCKTGLRR